MIFVDDIIFGADDEASDKFADKMKKEFEMSMIGEMKYFGVCRLYRIVKVF